MAYQTFPWIKGSSSSFEKLLALELPNLENKSFLDVGCNEGFFCGFARFAGAKKVTGVDINQSYLDIAKALFPDCEFICQSWDSFGEEKYDVILNSSAIHYAEDPKKLIDLLVSRLAPNGTLVLEIGIAPGEHNGFVEVTRAIDKRYFPTSAKVREMLEDHVYKYITQSVQQAGDPIPRYVYHISRKLPYAILLLDDPHAGKTSTVKNIFNRDINVLTGDLLYREAVMGKIKAPPPLEVIFRTAGKTHDWGYTTYRICKHGLFEVFCEWIADMANRENFILDMYIPAVFREQLAKYLEQKDYYVVNVNLQKAVSQPRKDSRPLKNGAGKYREYLEKEYMINMEDYLAANPDVEKALREGKITSALAHYIFHGRKEGRKRSLKE